LDFYLAKLAEMRGSSFEDVSLKMLRASIWRSSKATKKSPDFYSPLQDHLRIERHLDDISIILINAPVQLKNIAQNREKIWRWPTYHP
jgi:hypothetical protein